MNMEIRQDRMKSWALWTSIAALIVFCVKQFTGFDLGPFMNEFMDLLLPVLVGFGIVNNPTSKNTL